jgi:hypothetical protein
MITIDIVGGLGNQLFKIFTVIAYSLENAQPFVFEYREKVGNRFTYWNSFLSRLKVFTTMVPNSKAVLQNALQDRTKVLHSEPRKQGYAEIPNYQNRNVFLKGYFQSHLYFERYRDKIFQIIGLENHQTEIRQHFIQYFDGNHTTISMHFRLGDYINLPNSHPIIPYNYYENSIQYLFDKLGKGGTYKILYFCEKGDNNTVLDSIIKLKQRFHDRNVSFIKIDDSIDDWKQVIIMSLCHHNIIANSTFSWWGAYFGVPENRVVCYPDIWYGTALKYIDMRNMFPNDWQKIDCV